MVITLINKNKPYFIHQNVQKSKCPNMKLKI